MSELALPTRLLFVCSQNRWRSLTAEELFENHPTVQARSAGTEAGARVRVQAGHLGWAEVIFVMEKRHAERLRIKFGDALQGKPLVNLRAGPVPARRRGPDSLAARPAGGLFRPRYPARRVAGRGCTFAAL